MLLLIQSCFTDLGPSYLSSFSLFHQISEYLLPFLKSLPREVELPDVMWFIEILFILCLYTFHTLKIFFLCFIQLSNFNKNVERSALNITKWNIYQIVKCQTRWGFTSYSDNTCTCTIHLSKLKSWKQVHITQHVVN